MPKKNGGIIGIPNNPTPFKANGVWGLKEVSDYTILNSWVPFTATGGTITTVGNDKIHTFTSSGTFTVTSGYSYVEYLVVGGGGGGATSGSGGGAGAYVTGTTFLYPGSYTITIGAGGAGGTTGTTDMRGKIGNRTYFGNIVAIGGGYGVTHGGRIPGNGGSGGGAPVRTDAVGTDGAYGTLNQGFSGGAGYVNTGWNGRHGGGGGAGGPGMKAGETARNGDGGPGRFSLISGTSTAYAGGGAGGEIYSQAQVVYPGIGGGGTGGSDNVGGNGTANTGAGGGGGGYTGTYFAGGSGGSGIVIIRYQPYAKKFNIEETNLDFYIDFSNTASYSGSSSTIYNLTSVAPSSLTKVGSTYSTTNGGIMSFNGTNTDQLYASTNVFDKVNGNPLTVSTFFKAKRNAGQYQEIVANRSDSAYNWMLFQHTTDGSIQLHGSAQNKSTYIPPLNQWINVTATVSVNGVSRLYINGVLVQVVTGYTYGSAASYFCIGSFGASRIEPNLCDIGDVQVYSRELDQREVINNFNLLRSRYGI